jgi:hypothetical protein
MRGEKMTIAKTKEVVRTKMAELWLDEKGILHIINQDGAKPDLDEAKAHIEATKKFGSQKRPILVDITRVKSVSKEAREFYSGPKGAERTNGLAMIINSPVAKVIGNFLIGINKPIYPIKLFSSEDEAIDWLQQFLDD